MKKVFKAVIFCLILAFLLAFANRILMPDTDFSADTDGLEDVDYIMLGTSNIFYAINPLVIWNETGYTGYNLSSEQAPLIISYYQLKNEFKKHIPKTVFLDCAAFQYNYGTPSFNQLSLDKMPFNRNKIELISRLGEDDENNQIKVNGTYSKINYYIPLYKFHERWKNIFEGNLRSEYHYKYEHTFLGYVATKDVFVYERYYKWLPTLKELGGTYLKEISELNLMYLDKIRTLCAENDVELILMKTPSKMWTKEICEDAAKYAAEAGLEYFDMNEEQIIDELGIDENKDFADSFSHFNIYGTEKVSVYLGDYMKKNCGFDDKRGTGADMEQVYNALYKDYTGYRDSK